MLYLYVLLIYGFNRTLRFNSSGEFNLPVGNVDLNKNTINSLNDYFIFMQKAQNIRFFNLDFVEFLEYIKVNSGDFIYFDPPYFINDSEYNKKWNENLEIELYKILQKLDIEGIKWGLSNLTHHKGRENLHLINFAKNYKIYNIKSNYISFNNIT